VDVDGGNKLVISEYSFDSYPFLNATHEVFLSREGHRS
jgi:hypothetical protein